MQSENIFKMNVTDSDIAGQVEDICYNYIVPIICAFGILCNILNLLILTDRHLKESPYSYLTAMAVTDLCALGQIFIFMVLSRRHKYDYYWRFYDAHLYYPLVNIASNSSVWLIVMLTIERFLFVRHPFWAKVKCDRAGANIKIAAVIILIGIINIPRFLAFKVSYNSVNQTYSLNSTTFRETFQYTIINWFYSVIINFVPLVILSVSNIYLVFAVQKARAQRKILNLRNNKEATWLREQMRLTITLISIVCLFIVCVMPSAFADRPSALALFGNGQKKEQFLQSTPYRILQTISNLLVICNLSLNFVLYCAFNDKFVRVLKKMLQRWVKVIRRQRQKKSFMKMSGNKTTVQGQTSVSSTTTSNHGSGQNTRMTTSA